MDKVKEKLLEDFKRSNKTRKLTLAKRYGFGSPEEYLAYLNQSAVFPEPNIQKVVIKPTIHNVVLLDATGSMRGNKYDNAQLGINKELEWLKAQTDVNYTETIIEFIEAKEYNGSAVKTNPIAILKSPEDVQLKFYGAHGSDTPLYKSVLDIIEEVSSQIKDTDKVLLKVYTDGGNNSLSSFQTKCKNKIKEVQGKNFTVTFVGTKSDLASIQKNLELEASNCLEIENTGKGFETAFETSFISTQTYAKKVIAGEDVSIGFYKSIVK